jgi:hypothetical protein
MTSNKDRLPPGSTILMVGILMFCEYLAAEALTLTTWHFARQHMAALYR